LVSRLPSAILFEPWIIVMQPWFRQSVRSDRHQRVSHLGPPDLEPALQRAQHRVRIAGWIAGMCCLEAGQEFASRP